MFSGLLRDYSPPSVFNFVEVRTKNFETSRKRKSNRKGSYRQSAEADVFVEIKFDLIVPARKRRDFRVHPTR